MLVDLHQKQIILKLGENFMKKFTSILLTLITLISVLSFSSVSYAQNTDVLQSEGITTNSVNGETITEYNEYEMYKKIASKTDAQLKAEGYSDENIEYIRDFDFEEEIRLRASLPYETLKTYGYTDSEIKELKEIKSTDTLAEIQKKSIARATLGSSIRIHKKGTLTENGKKVNYVDLKYMFKWKRIPMFLLSDIVVIAFNSGNSSQYAYKKVSSYCMKAPLTVLSNNKTSNQNISWKIDTKSGKAVSAKFAIGLKNMDGTMYSMCWGGTGYLRLTNPKKARLYIDACYGHTTINIVPSFSVSTSGTASIGISLRKGMDARHDTGYYYDNFKIDNSYVYEGVVIGL